MRQALFFLILLSLFSCDQLKKYTTGTETKNENPNVIKKYHDNGRLKSIVEVNELRQRHGESKFYNEKGAITKSFVYDTNEKTKAVQYYENGNPILEINYKNDVKDGLLKRFYENGQVESETPYRDDYPGAGIKEYSKSGKLRTHYPTLIVKGIDQLTKNGKYIIEVYFDDQPGRGTYYMGELTDGTFMNYRLDKMEESNYKGQLILQPRPGTMIMEKLHFVGEFKTPTGNKYIVEKSFNLAIENSY